MLALYKSRLVKVDGRFKKIMMVAMVSYLAIAVMSFISSFFGVGGGWGFYGVGTLGLILCAFARRPCCLQPDAGLRLDRARREDGPAGA